MKTLQPVTTATFAQRVIAEDAPYISLWYKTNVAVSRKGLEGIKLTPSAEFTFLKDVKKF